MRNNMSYTKIGIFTLAGYPYSFKLLWSPIVDTLYFKSLGRRKSWILPLQLASAAIMIQYSAWVEKMLINGEAVAVTAYFFVLVLFAATQDIAVDGWALTLLSRRNVGYAATCQTVGMNIGYFASFTIFLALNDPEFCSKYMGTDPNGPPFVSLRQYLMLWGWIYFIVTIFIAIFKKEKVEKDVVLDAASCQDEHSNGNSATKGSVSRQRSSRLTRLSRRQISEIENGESLSPEQSILDGWSISNPKAYKEIFVAYSQLWKTITLPPVKLLCLVLVVARLGMLPAESVAPLKLLEKGVSKESLASLVLIEFPIELLSALVAGRWAASSHPLRPWLVGYKIRLYVSLATTFCVAFFPENATDISSAPKAFAVLVALGLATSFSSTLMFTALGDFYNRISDPSMGGAYLTMLNTVANIGVVVPKIAIFALIDFATTKQCRHPESGQVLGEFTCGSSPDHPGACEEHGGSCMVIRDGFYIISGISFAFGFALMFWLRLVLARFEKIPTQMWHAGRKD